MEKKMIVKVGIAAALAVGSVVFGCGIGRGGPVQYQLPQSYMADSQNAYSDVHVEMTVQDGRITDASISSSGDSDLLSDATREEWAKSIVDNQSADNDVISSATLSYSAASVQEAANDILVQAGLKEPEPEPTAEPEVEAEPVEGLTDGTYAAQKTTDFSTIDVELTVENGAVAAASVKSEGANDLLTDDQRAAWADQIVSKQAVDAVTGVTISSNAVQEAVDELMSEAQGGGTSEADAKVAELEAALAAAEAKAAEAEARVAELEAAAAASAEAGTEAAEAPAGELTDGTYATRKTTDFSDIDVAITVLNGSVTQASVHSEGANDLLTDEQRNAWADQIVANQAVDAVTGVTISSNAVQEAVDELMAEAKGGDAEAPAGELTDGTYATRKTTDFSDIDVAITVLNGNVTQASVYSEGANDLLTDEQRSAWADQIVEKQAVDAVTGVTISSNAVQEAVDELMAEAKGEETPATEAAEATADDGERLAAIMPYIVTTMGDNKENSYVTDYLEQDPYLVNIYEGYGFAKDYGSARGHEYTLEDLSKTQRPHPKANCITCKTPDLHKMIAENGVAVYSMPFDEVMAQMTNNIGCYTCHGADDGNGGAMVVTHQYVNEALGDNVSTIKPATLSCGQCHIEYYFTPEESETMMPYHGVDGMTPEAILAYYDDLGFADWTQESTGTRMLKAQHPEMETVMHGNHAALLSCADCHMPTETTDTGVEYLSHMLVSPLENEQLLNSCARCHGDTDMVAFVRGIQADVTARETETGNRLSAMKDALADAVASGAWSEDDLNAVRKLHREAQWFFDFCYVENSEGAHNTALANRCLDTSNAKIDEALALLGVAVETPAAETQAETPADVVRLMRQRPATSEAVEAEAEATGDATRMMRPRPATGETAEAGAEAAATGDATRMMRPRPATGETAEAEAGPAATGDATRMMRPRPATGETVEAEAEAAATGDATRMMRPRP